MLIILHKTDGAEVAIESSWIVMAMSAGDYTILYGAAATAYSAMQLQVRETPREIRDKTLSYAQMQEFVK